MKVNMTCLLVTHTRLTLKAMTTLCFVVGQKTVGRVYTVDAEAMAVFHLVLGGIQLLRCGVQNGGSCI